MQKTDRVTSMYFSDTAFKSAKDAAQLRRDLIKLSSAIAKREDDTTNAPKYLLLDPERLPFYSYI